MPNYVHHSLTITGPADERERFMRECFTETEKGPQLDFNKLIPEPAEIAASKGDPTIFNTEGCDLTIGGSRSAEFPAWYEWRCRHWGTKGERLRHRCRRPS